MASEKTGTSVCLSMVAYHSGAYQSIQWTIDKGNGTHLRADATLNGLIDQIEELVMPTEAEEIRSKAEQLQLQAAELLGKAQALEGGAA